MEESKISVWDKSYTPHEVWGSFRNFFLVASAMLVAAMLFLLLFAPGGRAGSALLGLQDNCREVAQNLARLIP